MIAALDLTPLEFALLYVGALGVVYGMIRFAIWRYKKGKP